MAVKEDTTTEQRKGAELGYALLKDLEVTAQDIEGPEFEKGGAPIYIQTILRHVADAAKNLEPLTPYQRGVVFALLEHIHFTCQGVPPYMEVWKPYSAMSDNEILAVQKAMARED